MQFQSLYQYIGICAVVFTIISCTNIERVYQPDYLYSETWQHDSNFYVEEDTTTKSVPFLFDNITFVPGRTMRYDVEYQLNDSIKYIYLQPSRYGIRDDIWWTSDIKELNNVSLINKISLSFADTTTHGRDMEYNQTLIAWNYMNGDATTFSVRTGVRENYRNIWLHPPRRGVFKIAFTCPWPYLAFPLEIGKEWATHWKWAGSYMGDPHYVEWEGIEQFNYNYIVTGKEIIETDNLNIECYIIKAKGVSKVGENSAEFAFHPDYGFLRLKYVGMDSSVLTLTADYFLDKTSSRSVNF